MVVAAVVAVAGCATDDGTAPTSPAAKAGATSPASDTASSKPGSAAAPTSVPPSQTGMAIRTVGRINIDGQRYDAPAPADPAKPAGDGKATCRNLSVAVAGDLTSRDGIDGAAIANGVQLAVDRFNAANPGCHLGLIRVDSKGNGVVAAEQAKRTVANASVVAVIGPLTSTDALAAGSVYNQAGLAALSPSATAPTLTDKGWKSFFRGVNNDDVQGEAIARHLVTARHRKKVCVIADDTDSGAGLAQTVTQGLGSVAVPGCAANVRRGHHDYAAAVDAVVKQGADGVYFAGAARDAGAFLTALRAAAPGVLFAAGDEANSPEFIAYAGSGADGALLSCSCAPDPAEFTKAFTEKFGTAPAQYSLEAYDLATIVIRGIAAKHQTRARLRDYVAKYSGDGVSRHYRWAPTGDLIGNAVWLSHVGPV
ncbi:branched chain amino acid ABC transporter substrate-binding protein [Gordonia crocea]|uniref:Branched chain amino acid ABC transporter substrate-binding protein n=2 Tax=Gordonia crocea TaxID=589162 RepID=A0A7I9UXZ7_9ACTN|nr:branched chain amino acid ABC transporter substrate-binding protein [Gordonia crocea]